MNINLLKNILSGVGVVAIIALLVISIKFGGMISKALSLDSEAIPTYMAMFEKVLDTGDAAKGMILKFKVNEDVDNEDVVESIKALAEEYNMRVTGDTKMFTMDGAKGTEIYKVRNISMCSLPIAKKFLAHSHEFGGFMPCRIMLIELADGTRYLYTMDLNLAIHGGKALPAEMLELAQHVQKAMLDIPARAAEGDF
ncbi:MAG: DUF302 domain-containing protein [Campylobacterota bacterium]|nr:DUF302 domain-containing protein [Campylobacterota bacterium]